MSSQSRGMFSVVWMWKLDTCNETSWYFCSVHTLELMAFCAQCLLSMPQSAHSCVSNCSLICDMFVYMASVASTLSAV